MIDCFHSVGLPARSILEVIDMVAGAGFAAIELNAESLPWAPAHVSPETSSAERQAIVAACRRHGLGIAAVGAHIGMVSSEKAAREAALTFVEGCADLAVDVGAPIIHVLSGVQGSGQSREQSWRWFADAVARSTDYAQRRGVVLGVEAIAGHLFHAVDDYHRLTRDLPGVPFSVNFDPSHLEVQGENPRRVVDELADRVVHVHLKDGKGLYPDFSFPPLGQGAIDFPILMRGLDRAGYAGAVSVEYEAQVFGFNESEVCILQHGLGFLQDLRRTEGA